MNGWKGLLACAAIAAIVVALLLQGEAHSHALVGKPAPDFQGDFAINGEPVKLSALKGKVVLVDFWATWCPPCVASIPHLVELSARHKSDGLEVVGVTMYNKGEELDSQRASFELFIRQHHMNYLVMALDDKQATETLPAYAVKGIPQVVLIDRQGVVRDVIVGGGQDAAIDRGVAKLLAEK